MNPDSGKLHEISESLGKVIGRVNPRPEETVEGRLARAAAKHAALADGEPVPGAPLPPDWPVLTVGKELKQIKGWRTVVAAVDVEAQTVTVRFERR